MNLGMPLLEIAGLTKSFYELTAVDNVSLKINDGELVGLIGPNGSGKTTLFNCVMHLLPIDEGQILFRGEDITNLKPHKIALKGISRTFQIIRLFNSMTTMENLLLAVQQHQGGKIAQSVLRTRLARRLEEKARNRALDLLDLVNMSELKDEKAENLSHGQKKILELCMALMSDPKLILLDEPAAALNPTLIKELLEHIREVNREGVAFFVIEHNMDVIMELCERIIVLDHGEQIAEGVPSKIREDQEVVAAYFGD